MEAFHVEVAGEHLVLARWTSFRSASEAEAFRAAIARALMRATPACICADWRNATLVGPDIAAILLSMLTGTNLHIVRSSILLSSDHVSFNIQAERLVREAASPHRRTFRNIEDQLAFIGEVIAPAELAAAREFLEQGAPR